MKETFTLTVNGNSRIVSVNRDTPLLYVLRDDLGLSGPKYGCGNEQCGACKVLVDGTAVPSCKLPVAEVHYLPITTVAGLGTADSPHPLQEAFITEQASQCGYCTAGMIIAAQGLLNRTRYPTDDEIRVALADNLCRCGTYDRVRRAVKLRIGRPEPGPTYTVIEQPAGAAAAAPPFPRSFQQNPMLDAWIRINEDETITVFTGKVEIGQGIKTAVAQIAAEELDVVLARIRVETADTASSPNEGLTAGSMSLEVSGAAIRHAAAAARQFLLSVAYEELEAPRERLRVVDGTISDPGSRRATTYWKLHAGRPFGRPVPENIAVKDNTVHQIVGRPAQRLDIPAKVCGAPAYVHDLRLPGMVYGRIVRPPQVGAVPLTASLEPVRQMPGVLQVVRDGRFFGVIAEKEWQAVQGASALQESIQWQREPYLPAQDELYEVFRAQKAQSFPVIDGTAVNAPVSPAAAAPDGARTVQAVYKRPYQMHAALGPSAAVALLQNGKMTVWTHSQGVFLLRAALASVLEMAEEDIHVLHREGAGCYGHNGADDAALDAALLARACPARPVALQWSRADEHAREPYAPAMMLQMQASLDGENSIINWHQDLWSPTHFGRPRSGPGTSGLLSAHYLARPLAAPPDRPGMGTHSGSHRNADPVYVFTRRRIVKHFLPHSPLRVSTFRGLGAFANVFAIESFMDELARAAGVDPVAFRMQHLTDPRAHAVVKAAVEKAGWQARPRPQQRGYGRGFAYAQYKNRQTRTAVVVDLHVSGAGEIHLERVIIAADAGRIINPDGLSNQLEGGFVQAASMALYEKVRFDRYGVTSVDWDSYPIMRFPDAPTIETVLLNRPDQPTVGAGEAVQGPTPAAIANAIFDATGRRLREIPLSLENL